MKKKIVGTIIFILLLLPILTPLISADQETDLEIEIIGRGKIRRNIYFIVRNIGDTAALNVQMNGRIDGGLIIGLRGYAFKGYSSISPEEEVRHLFIIPGLGVGSITITVTADADNAEAVDAAIQGFLFGRFILLPDFVITS